MASNPPQRGFFRNLISRAVGRLLRPPQQRYFPEQQVRQPPVASPRPPTGGPLRPTVRPPAPDIFGFPDESPPMPVEPMAGQEWYGSQQPGTVPISNEFRETFWGTPAYWSMEVSTRSGESLINEFALDNIEIIYQLIDLGVWDNTTGSEDWRRFREDYAQYVGPSNRYSSIYGR